MGIKKLSLMLIGGSCCYILIQVCFIGLLYRHEVSPQQVLGSHHPPNKRSHPHVDRLTTNSGASAALSVIDSLAILERSSNSLSDQDPTTSSGLPPKHSSVQNEDPTPATAKPNAGGPPKLYLHIGPSKTATTTVQKDLSHLVEERVFRQDNFVYWGRYRGSGNINGQLLPMLSGIFDPKCLSRYEVLKYHAVNKTLDQADFPDCLIQAQHVIDEIKASNKSLIISNEAYSYMSLLNRNRGLYQQRSFFSNLHLMFKGWDITIVVSYRRMFEWMLSCVKESNAKIGLYGKHKRMLWPDLGGKPMDQPWPLIKSWSIRTFYSTKVLGTYTPFYMYLDKSIPMWKAANFTVKVLNVHSEHHITQQLLCDLLADSAPVSCRYVQQHREDSSYNSRSMAWTVYNQIVFVAANRGLLDKDYQKQTSRIEATDALEHFHQKILQKSLPDLPLSCPPVKDVERILNISLGKEEQWMPDFFRSPQGEPEHRKSFARLVYEKRELCSLDTATLFENQTTWKGLLANLNRTTAWPIRYDGVFSTIFPAYPLK